MANNGKVTSLAFVLTTENGSKNITTAEFNFSGDISVNQAAKLVDHFKGLASGINDNETKNVPVSNNIPDTIGIPVSNNVPEMKNESGLEETDSDDELHEVISDDEGLNMRGRHLSHMLYPIRGIPILLDNVRNYKSHILKAWKTYSSVLVNIFFEILCVFVVFFLDCVIFKRSSTGIRISSGFLEILLFSLFVSSFSNKGILSYILLIKHCKL